MSVKRDELNLFLENYLEIKNFIDYGPNGLQIEGKEEIKKIAFSVSATKKSIESAIENKADALIVHHGLFWKFHGVRTITGTFAKRVLPLIKSDINLFGIHLPLDAHFEVGNAATLAKKIGLEKTTPFGDHKGSPTGVKGTFLTPQTADELKKKIESVLNHNVILSGEDGDREIQTMGIITGGANGDWVHAESENLDSYLTGEISEHDWHESQEAGIYMFAGGHHATEQFGIQALMDKLKETFPVDVFYIDSKNPA